ncbi:hypothetical protein P389DRAFT_176512 [Cystobasidium minutum MCA 4210]|uniref:uncharacterized protein n=1 Tax=Cystobasidium minutum MCA 4210 TaxID=1397322 RepID=UPI0034CEFB23|eukprot:jgi/Rhomi1/176512/fgenesh1_pg.1_\
MLSNTQSLFNLFIALITLQQATSALALPTRGSYGQLARRANAARKTSPSQTARARLARAQNAIKRASAATVDDDEASKLASPVNSTSDEGEKHFATPVTHTIKVNPKLELKQSEATKAKLASSRSGTSLVDSDGTNTTSSTTVEEEEDDASNKAASIGGGYSMFAANNGVAPSSSIDAAQATPSASSWVSATNVTLPSGLSKRELVSNQQASKPQQQLLKKRVVPHPGAPSATIKINVIGGDVLQNFTIIETSKASSTKTLTSVKPAQTAINVNIVHNGTGSSVPDADSTLLTFTFTLPLAAISTGNETVTLKPAGNDSYIPYVNGKEVDTEESDNHNKATCTIPVDDDVLVAVARGQTFYAACTSSDAVSKRIRVKVDVSSTKDKRQMIAHFQAPSSTTSEKAKRQMVAFFEAPSSSMATNQEESNPIFQSTASAEEAEAVQYTREYMMSDLWEDCIIGIDEGCLEIPEE